jgi:hypothetical protein
MRQYKNVIFLTIISFVIFLLFFLVLPYIGLSNVGFSIGGLNISSTEYWGLAFAVLILTVGIGGCLIYFFGKKK